MIIIDYMGKSNSFHTPKEAAAFLVKHAKPNEEFVVNGVCWIYLDLAGEEGGEFKVSPMSDKDDYDTDCYWLTLDEVEEDLVESYRIMR